MNIGKIIKKSREKKGFQQKELAKIIGVKAATVSAWEADKIKPSLDIFFKLVDELDIIGDIFSAYQQQKFCLPQDIIKAVRQKIDEMHTKIKIIEDQLLRLTEIVPLSSFSPLDVKKIKESLPVLNSLIGYIGVDVDAMGKMVNFSQQHENLEKIDMKLGAIVDIGASSIDICKSVISGGDDIVILRSIDGKSIVPGSSLKGMFRKYSAELEKEVKELSQEVKKLGSKNDRH